MKAIFADLDKKTINLILKFEYFSCFISILGIIGLFLFLKCYINSILYPISIALFRSGLLAGICSFCFGVSFNKLKNAVINK